MAADFRCDHCGQNFKLPSDRSAATLACPHCRRPVSHERTTVKPASHQSTQDWSRKSEAATTTGIGPGAILGDRYEVDKELGNGAFGVVYRAFDTRLSRKPVAIKILLEDALKTPDAVRRFRDEGKVLCTVDHAHVPAVLDIGEVGNQQYIVLAFVKGKTVKELIPPGGMSDPVAAVQLAVKLIRTLHDIYSQWSIVHRDVKPANMMVPDNQKDGLYLMDFGLAVCHTTDATRTQAGTVLGTPAYMSPEQAKGDIIGTGHPSDLYSAAAVLYHLLTGRPPFIGDGVWELLRQIVQDPPEPPSKYRAGLDAELDAIVLKALSKEAKDRYATGAAFAEQLELWAARAFVRKSAQGVRAVVVGSTPGQQLLANPSSPQPTTSSGVRPPTASKATPKATKLSEQSSVVTGSTVNNPRSVIVKPQAPQPPPPPPQRSSQTSQVAKPLSRARRSDASKQRQSDESPSESGTHNRLLTILGIAVMTLVLLGLASYGLFALLGSKSGQNPPGTIDKDQRMKPWQRE